MEENIRPRAYTPRRNPEFEQKLARYSGRMRDRKQDPNRRRMEVMSNALKAGAVAAPAIGAAAGGVIGAVPSFGVGLAPGIAAGTAVGGAVGAAAGVGSEMMLQQYRQEDEEEAARYADLMEIMNRMRR